MHRLRVACSAVAAGVISTSFSAFAADDASSLAAAQALFAQGRNAMAAGDYAAACPKFEESYRLVPGVGTKFNLAECYEHVGRTASAWGAFLDVAATSKLAGQKERETAAAARAHELETQLCRLVIQVTASHAKNFVVARDDNEVGIGQWGASIPIDPGTHTVHASATGLSPYSKSVQIASCPSTTTVVIAPLSEDPLTVPEADSTKGAPELLRPLPPRRSATRSAVALSSLGLGLMAAGVGTYFGVHAISLRNESNDGHCMGNTCDDQGRRLRSDSLSAGTGATISLITSGAFLALGTILWLTDPKHN